MRGAIFVRKEEPVDGSDEQSDGCEDVPPAVVKCVLTVLENRLSSTASFRVRSRIASVVEDNGSR